MIPGSNLLVQALTLISSQTVTYHAYIGRTTTSTGLDVSEFAPSVGVLEGSVQAVPLSRYSLLGLDFKKKYVTWFVPLHVVGLDRDRSSDEFTYERVRYSVVNETDWFAQDGWVCLLGVAII